MNFSNLVRMAEAMVEERFIVGKVRGIDDSGRYVVQVAGSSEDFTASSVEGATAHRADDEVLLELEHARYGPVILRRSPWRENGDTVPSTQADGSAWRWADISDGDAAVAENSTVAANLAAAHDRVHALFSAGDHTDVDGSAAAGTILAYVSEAWQPVIATLDGGTY